MSKWFKLACARLGIRHLTAKPFCAMTNCYVEDVYHVWNECYCVLKHGGVLLAGMNNGLDYLVEEDNPLLIVNKLPYNPRDVLPPPKR